MKNDRLRQSLKSDYAHALGVAAYCFSICEWNAVYCAERIQPGSLSKFVGEELTAGQIAKKLTDLVRNMPNLPEREQLTKAAKDFLDLVIIRNRILHGKPCAAPSGEARLSFKKIWEISDLEDAADLFSTCSIELNRLFHGFLSTYDPNQNKPSR